MQLKNVFRVDHEWDYVAKRSSLFRQRNEERIFSWTRWSPRRGKSHFLKFKELFKQAIVQCIILILKDDTTGQQSLKNVNSC